MSDRERKDWERTIKEIVQGHKQFLVYIGSEHRT